MDFGSIVNTVRENSQQAAENKDKAKDGENNGKGLDVIEEEQLLQANNNNGEKQESQSNLSQGALSANKRRSKLLD